MIPVKDIKIADRKRNTINRDKVKSLAESIKALGLINPITVAPDNSLIAGVHRIEAVKLLGWEAIPHRVLDFDDAIDAEIAEIDENLMRSELSALEESEHIADRERLLAAKGLRANVGPPVTRNQNNGETVSPLKTTEQLAADIGIDKRSYQHRKQIGNNIDDEVKDQIRETKIANSTTDLLELARADSETQKAAVAKVEAGEAKTVKAAKKKIKTEQQIKAIEETELPQGQYNVIAIDPPWRYKNRAQDETHRAGNPYPDMSIDEIKAINIPELVADDAIVWLWVTNAFMKQGYEIAEHWGLEVKTILTWVKDKMGLGDWLRGQTEHCLMCVKGKPPVNLTNQTTVIDGPLREHSRKPDSFYQLVDGLCAGAKLDYFSRETREGWSTFGIETIQT